MDFINKYTDRQVELDEFMQTRVPPKRYEHCKAVSRMAAELAEIYGADVDKARFAGMYHDIAKAFKADEMNGLLAKYGVPEDRYFGNRALAHSKLGKAMLEQDYGVTDEDILMAVSSHTTGRSGMSLLEEIVFTADAVDETRTYDDVEYYRNLARTDLDRACLEILDFNIGSVTAKGMKLDEDTLKARDFIASRILMRDKEELQEKNHLMETYEIAKAIAAKLSERKAREIRIINIAEKSSFADYFVNATAGSERQLGALLDDVDSTVMELGIEPKGVEGRAGTGWILIDCGDIIVNLFTAETRDRYALDKIWSDCEIEIIEE